MAWMDEYSRVLRGSLVVHAAARNSYSYIIIRSRSRSTIKIITRSTIVKKWSSKKIDDRRSLENDRRNWSTIGDRENSWSCPSLSTYYVRMFHIDLLFLVYGLQVCEQSAVRGREIIELEVRQGRSNESWGGV